MTQRSTACRPPARATFHGGLLGLLLCASLGCSPFPHRPEADADSVESAESGGEASPDAEAKAARKRKDKIRDKGKEIARKERALHVAQLELKLARKEGDEGAAAHEWSMEEAARELEATERKQARFSEIERPLQRAERALAVDRAERRLHDARTDLEGILAIYAEETEASSKEEIIARHRRDVEFAERALEIQRQKAELALRVDEQERERTLTVAMAKGQRQLDRQRHEKEQARVKSELGLMTKEHALIDIEEDLDELRTELRKLKKAAAE